MNSHQLTDHDHLQIRNLMILGHTWQEATRAYLHQHKDTSKAADRLHFLKICNRNFTVHAYNIMKADMMDIEKVVTVVNQLGLFTNSLDANQFVLLVNELIHEDLPAVNKLTKLGMTFQDALIGHLRHLLAQPDQERMVQVSVAFRNALIRANIKRFRMRYFRDTTF